MGIEYVALEVRCPVKRSVFDAPRARVSGVFTFGLPTARHLGRPHIGTLWPWFIVFNAESVVECRLHAPESAQTGGRWEGRPVGTRKRVNLKPSKYKLVLDHNFWVRPQKSGPSQLEGLANANPNKKNGTSNSGVEFTNVFENFQREKTLEGDQNRQYRARPKVNSLLL